MNAIYEKFHHGPLLAVKDLTKFYGDQIGCQDVNFDLWPGEVLGIVGESGSGKSTVLSCISGQMPPSAGNILYNQGDAGTRDLFADMDEPARRLIRRTDWAFVHQNPRDGLRMTVSAGANIGERLMAIGHRHYGNIRTTASDWLDKVEIDRARLDDLPALFLVGCNNACKLPVIW